MRPAKMIEEAVRAEFGGRYSSTIQEAVERALATKADAEPVEKRRGIAQVSLHLLGELLGLPAGHEVVLVRQSPTLDDVAELMIGGPQMPEVRPGQAITRVGLVSTAGRRQVEFAW